jgi:hypothetical protein
VSYKSPASVLRSVFPEGALEGKLFPGCRLLGLYGRLFLRPEALSLEALSV